MLKAILHSKVGTQFSDLKKWENWREVYSTHEDFLTASIFGRLIYLNPSLIWDFIKKAVVSNHKLPDEVGSLKGVHFWPKWALPTNHMSDSRYKEPDVCLNFDKTAIIVEPQV